MSHLTTYKSEVLTNCNKFLLRKAVQDIGLDIDYNIKTIANTWINANVDAGFLKDGQPISIGVKFVKDKANTKLEVEGDFFGTGVNQESFINKLAQAYKKQDVIYQCKEQGWTIENDDICIDSNTNEIIIKASRYVV